MLMLMNNQQGERKCYNQRMGKIKILPENVANKIAAGEVVERPASVVKELVENSLDAQVSQIKVEVESGGIKKILVIDDGTGMDKEDIQKCFLRHGTSKIFQEEDLLSIKSLGFRGEALSSIAAVSKMKIKSKVEKETAGTLLELEAGETKKISSAGMPTGTSIEVSDLFFNVPARRKFLKSSPTEFRHIIDIITTHSLACENIGFVLKHNGKLVFSLEKNLSREEKIKELLGEEVFRNLLAVFFSHPHLKIEGFVSKPSLTAQASYKQFTFVNKRGVKDRVIAAAVKEAYGTLLPAKTYPIFFLYLTLPYEMVDVNVHPRKEEVKFVNSQFIFQSVKAAVSQALVRGDLTPSLQRVTRGPTRLGQVRPPKPRDYNKERAVVGEKELEKELKFYKELLPWEEELKVRVAEEILQVHNLYLIKPTEEGILIVDQHAAHERILYEKLIESFKSEKKENISQALLLPLTVELSFSEAEILRENLKTLTRLGFEIEEFGRNSFKINSVPNILKAHDIVSLITEVIEDLGQERPPKEVDEKSLRTIVFLACRSAIKAGDPLSKEECRDLLEKLEETKTKYTCPHGRPVKVIISLAELQKMFKRT